MRDAGKEVLKEILEAYQLRIREALLNGSLAFPHSECAGDKGFKGRGWKERSIREVGRRIKKVGGSGTDKGALNLIKLLWKRVFENDELKKF